MASKRDAESSAPEPVSVANGIAPDTPRLIIAGGRGKVGKSSWLRWAIEQNIARGGTPVIADGDRTNPTLLAVFPEATRPRSGEDEDVRDWLNELVEDQIETRRTTFLDLGGGDTILKQWSRELDLAQFLHSYGVTPVLLHVLGSDIDDLAYLRDLETVFAPPHTAIVLNEGMVPSGRSPLAAFEPFLSNEIFQAACKRGAAVVKMPRLGCMQDVDRRRIGFADAEAGNVKPGQEKLGPVRRQMVAMWRREMVAGTAPIASWIM
ncbi:MAG: hypothetical protein ABSC06_32020 [Rhodopila sp.]|jgi:hypothetical protein